MAGNPGFNWAQDPITPKLLAANPIARQYISRVTTYMSLQVEDYARINARWHDRTGNARASLTGLADNSNAGNDEWEIILYGGMPYSIWLETRWGGKYAIIRPTIETEAPVYFKMANQVMDVMFGGGGGNVNNT